MATIDKDLWGDFALEDIEISPLSLLNHQASLLREKTNDSMRGEVISRIFFPHESKTEKILHQFNVVVPGLKNRRVELFRAGHDVNKVFPIDLIMASGAGFVEKADNLDEFKHLLSKFLAEPFVKSTLNELYMELKVKTSTKPLFPTKRKPQPSNG